MLDLHAAIVGVAYLVAITCAARWTVASAVRWLRLRRRLYPHGVRLVIGFRTRGANGGTGRPRRHQESMPGPRSILAGNCRGRIRDEV
jgi:hypothetical protein